MSNSLYSIPVYEFQTFTSSDDLYDELKAASHIPSLPECINSIRRSTRTLKNRLQSIHTDAQFVLSVAEHYGGLPIVTNARAGDWYVDPRNCAGRVYFKSTDGHTGEWGFSMRRLNLGLLEILGRDGGRGAIVVDSTRRGKRFPDSLSKTIPIWIAVLNSALFPALPLELYTTPLAVSQSEHSQISSRLPGFLKDFLLLGLDLQELRKRICRPLRPLFVTPSSSLPDGPLVFKEFIPLVLVTASIMTQGLGTEGEYIQGAGDDHEGWASEPGLTPPLFWANSELLLNTDSGKLLNVIQRLDHTHEGNNSNDDYTLIKPTSNMFICSRATLLDNFHVVVNCSLTPLTLPSSIKHIHLPILPDKRGNKQLRLGLPLLFAELRPLLSDGQKVAFLCETGNDVAPAVALAILSCFYGDDGKFGECKGVNKVSIKKRLAWIGAVRPAVNPARGLLNAVNSVLM